MTETRAVFVTCKRHDVVACLICAKIKRGTIQRFREYLNKKFAMSEKHTGGRSGQYQQKTRLYGDYIYNQDRAQFNVELDYALTGNDHKDFQP